MNHSRTLSQLPNDTFEMRKALDEMGDTKFKYTWLCAMQLNGQATARQRYKRRQVFDAQLRRDTNLRPVARLAAGHNFRG